MTTLVARQPLQTLSMSSSQRPPRRLSARLQEKEDAQPHTNGYHLTTKNQTLSSANDGVPMRRSQDKPPAAKKRRIDYDEEDDGFMFTRAKAHKPRPSTSKIVSIPEQHVPEMENSRPARVDDEVQAHQEQESKGPSKKRRNKMSFSTPNVRVEKPVRRSKRLSDDVEGKDGSPQQKISRRDEAQQETKRPPERQKTPLAPQAQVEEDHSSTKIALPFADTPVIRKNKAMRERKSGKGERRSSLGLRGRRASSLIDTGNSNALPHSEVEVADFYKHIESEGLPEPRRMRQLLTWCATRAMGNQSGVPPHAHPEYEDQSAHLAARVIQEELLKDFANRSEMSDWFGREEAQKPEETLPLRPNPKNAQNTIKIEELEAQIRRLKSERKSLEALLRPPSIPSVPRDNPRSSSHVNPPTLHNSLLSHSDISILETLNTSSASTATISSRINNLSATIGPSIDAFADGIHKVAQYRDAAERVSSRVLSICAQKLEERDKEGRRRAVGAAGDVSDDLTGVLRSLSKIER
ncbi:hypothetical protein EPUS_00822 [Endocarpon pusillum Z07020]|uniref:Mis12-Mtw1 family protein n=1 Tax=Endocarpon pusillum (strain Z07020 / HMAS-L-300199) TaxID=1263415 RepID=U1GAY8_ENDPU|nr:uncharacterized protein EPUS_00822 [Endocarpon pusillum Z07020]ERF74692.1 hypothetical protein EPUS_00822 [Endocarpon pusillum Z07020]